LRNLLTTDAVLLVSEREGCSRNCPYVHVIQRRVCGGVELLAHVEGDVAEAEGLRSAFRRGGMGVLGRSQEPVEGDDAEVDDVLVGVASSRVLGVQFFGHAADDWYVGRVGAFGGVVCALEAVEESSQ